MFLFFEHSTLCWYSGRHLYETSSICSYGCTHIDKSSTVRVIAILLFTIASQMFQCLMIIKTHQGQMASYLYKSSSTSSTPASLATNGTSLPSTPPTSSTRLGFYITLGAQAASPTGQCTPVTGSLTGPQRPEIHAITVSADR